MTPRDKLQDTPANDMLREYRLQEYVRAMSSDQLVSYRVWDAPTRWFHWINALTVLGLILVGILILFAGSLGISPAGRVAAPNVDPSPLTPLARDLMDQNAYTAIRSFRAPFVETHEFIFYLLGVVVILHVAAVVVTELRYGGTLVSAMLTGRKIVPSNSRHYPPNSRPKSSPTPSPSRCDLPTACASITPITVVRSQGTQLRSGSHE